MTGPFMVTPNRVYTSFAPTTSTPLLHSSLSEFYSLKTTTAATAYESNSSTAFSKFPLGAARKRYKPRPMRAERGNELHNGKLIVQNCGFRSWPDGIQSMALSLFPFINNVGVD